MENNIFTRLWLCLVYLFEIPFKIVSWTVWVFSNQDISKPYYDYKNNLTDKMFKNE